jgi:hypothetical protein
MIMVSLTVVLDAGKEKGNWKQLSSLKKVNGNGFPIVRMHDYIANHSFQLATCGIL